jgi:anhydro-N-acetylmuramic acid kinase
MRPSDRAEGVAVVGFHGQTVIHKPQARLTVQVGDGPGLAKRLGIPVVYDFRSRTTWRRAGRARRWCRCSTAPSSPRSSGRSPVAVLNIGGVANVTFCDGGPDPIACDTGPGNALIDDFMRAHTGARYDDNGDVAATGKPDPAFIARVLEHPFFDRKPPKSLDRDDFALANIGLPELSLPDGAATLSALTVEAVARVVPHLPEPPRAWIVAGGGARNATLMRMLGRRLANASVETADQAGWSADALEAQAFAFLAVRSLRGCPSRSRPPAARQADDRRGGGEAVAICRGIFGGHSGARAQHANPESIAPVFLQS